MSDAASGAPTGGRGPEARAELGTGWFQVEAAADRCWWSDGMYAVHGLAPGDVVPTVALVLAHQHPDDRSGVAAVLERVATDGARLACASRLLGFDGRTHDVVLSMEPTGGPHGGRYAVRGTLVLLDGLVGELARRRADVQLAEALESRSVIDQGKGVLAVAAGYGAEEAFDVLRAVSQRRNVRVRHVADELVRAARALGSRAPAAWLGELLGDEARQTARAAEQS